MNKQKGLALVLVLWVLSLLTIMAGSFALSMRREASITSGIKQTAQAQALAESGITFAETMLLIPDKTKTWRTDGSIYQINTTDAQIRVRLFAEAGKIDLNKADEKQLKALFSGAPILPNNETEHDIIDPVSAIIDWRDGDDLIHLNGAEKKQYLAAGLSYTPRNKPLQSLEELQLILGMNEDVLNWLEPLITLYSGQAKVNLQLASRELLQTMPDLDPQLMRYYLQERKETAQQGLPPPAFPTNGQLIPTTRNINNADNKTETSNNKGDDNQENEALAEPITVAAVTIIAQAVLIDGSNATLKALVKTSDGTLNTPFYAVRWQRDVELETSLFDDTMDDLVISDYGEPELNN